MRVVTRDVAREIEEFARYHVRPRQLPCDECRDAPATLIRLRNGQYCAACIARAGEMIREEWT